MENTTPLESPELKSAVGKFSPFFAETRKRLIVTLCVFAAATLAGFFFYERIIKFLIDILGLKGVNIVFTSPFQFINLAINSGIAMGLIFTFPLLIYQILSFLRPALRKKEFRMMVWFLPFSIILFLIGFSVGVYVMKWQIKLFLTKSVSLGIGNVLDVSHLISTVLLISVLMGIAFQFPIVTLLLLRIGIIKHNTLSEKRLWFYLGSIIFTILLPLDSILADVLLTLPLIVLFELTLILNRFFERKKLY